MLRANSYARTAAAQYNHCGVKAMDRVQSLVFVLLLSTLSGSLASMLFSFAFQYPVAETTPRLAGDYDTSFWDLSDAETTPLDIVNISDTIEAFESTDGPIQLNRWEFDYYSETYNDVDIRISSVLLQPVERTGPTPSVLVLHGYGDSYFVFIENMKKIAAAGYIVMGINGPGTGASTPYPPLNPYTFFDISDGPESAHIYHSVWAAARAITLLESLPYVNSTALLGWSMGGIETFILSAIDPRVDASIPMIAGGNLNEPIYSGSLLNALINPTYEVGSEELATLQTYFDPIPYARMLTKPIFMLFGTSDPFFVLSGLRQTVNEITAPLTLSIRPNWGHNVDITWTDMIIRWLDEQVRSGPSYPSVAVEQTESFTGFGWTLHISAAVSIDMPLYLCWRTSDPGSVWAMTPMAQDGNTYSIDVTPSHIGKVTYFVCTLDGTYLWTTSPVREGFGASLLMPLTALLSGLGAFVITRATGWRLTRSYVLRETPMLTGLFMMSLGLLLPFYGISGRVQLSIVDFVEVFGNLLGLGGWFLSLIVIILCFIYSLSTMRHQLPFKLIMAVWVPLLVIITIVYIVFAGVFAIAGGLASIYTGVGAYLLLFAVPVMLIMESFSNRIVFDVKNVLPVPVSPSS
ncbi:MAG: alpha/beta fold hydrolase [Candidatus Thorarchaeota archaeon]|nr:alpha/beta fold hydrolase [Candidatus Thorarchaeota archaeon]